MVDLNIVSKVCTEWRLKVEADFKLLKQKYEGKLEQVWLNATETVLKNTISGIEAQLLKELTESFEEEKLEEDLKRQWLEEGT